MLTGLQSGLTSPQCPQPPASSSGLQPSCPPYWMMFTRPQQGRPNLQQRSYSLNPAILYAKFVISDSGDEEESAPEKAAKGCSGEQRPATLCQPGQRKAQRAFVPNLLNPPACLSSLPHQRRKNLRQCSLSGVESSKQSDCSPDQEPSKSPTTHNSPETRAQTGVRFLNNIATQMVRDVSVEENI